MNVQYYVLKLEINLRGTIFVILNSFDVQRNEKFSNTKTIKYFI